MSTRRFLVFAAVFWALFGIVAGIQVWISMFHHGHAVPWLLSYYMLVWLAWLAPTQLIVRLALRFPVIPPRAGNVLVHVAAATVIAVLHTLYWLGLLVWMRPYDRMTANLSELDIAEILFARLPLEWILYCLVLGCALAFEYYGRYRERALEAAELERSLADARLHALELQIQPHFLFNTLNAISGLVRSSRRDEAITMLAGLAQLLRYSLDHAGRQRVALGEELEVLKLYLEIQQARFPDRMRFRIELEDGTAQAAMPILILQPLAENAVRHGIAASAAGGEIVVRALRVGERLQVRMHNSGLLAPAPVEGIGLKNTRERLRNLYADDAHFRLASVSDGVLAELDLPWSTLP